MSKNTYVGANVIATDTFSGWVDKTNQVRDDMGTIVVTVTTASGAEPNTTNAGLTTGNLAIQGVVTANTIAVSSALRGGTVTSNGNLTITSNALFTTTGNVEFTAANNINVDANNLILSSNVTYDGATKSVRIDTANTTVNTGAFFVNSNTVFSANVTMSGANTTIGDSGTDILNIAAVTNHTANVTISAALTSVTGAITASNTLDVTGAITASNTLAVTGAITASNTLAVTGNVSLSANLSLLDNKYIRVGTGQDLLIYHDITNSYIKNNTGSLKIDAAQLDIVTSNTTATEVMATFDRDAGAALYYDNSKKFETTTTGVTVTGGTVITGDLTVQGVTNLSTDANFTVNTAISNISTVSSLFTSQGNTVLGDSNSDRLTVNANTLFSSNVTISGAATVSSLFTSQGNTTIGSSSGNRLDVNANTLFSSNVSISGTANVGTLIANSKNIAVGGNITTANSLTTSGNFALTLTQTGTTNITLPVSGTLVTRDGTETLTSKTLTSPVLTTPTLGVASATSINKVTITAPATGSTLTIANGKTATINNTLTLSGTDDASVLFGAGGTVAYISNKLSTFANTTSAELSNIISDNTGSGSLVFGTSPSLTTPTIADATLNGNTSISGNMTVTGNLTINGTTTTINSTTLSVDDKNIELGSVVTPTNTTADGGGITLKGTTDKTFNWINATNAWTSSEDLNLLIDKSYKINGVSVLSSTALGSGVISSNLTSVGTITTGTWDASTIAVNRGGTGSTTASGARTNLGLGTISTQNSNGVSITGGSITGITDLAIADGGTGASTAAGALVNLGLTASATELNYTSGVTSAIQTQLNAKAPLASPEFTGTVSTSSLNLGGAIVTAIATQAQAQAGTVNTVLMTPLSVAQAIDAQVPAPTAAQVGAATADLSASAVGTYAILFADSISTGFTRNSNYAGSLFNTMNLGFDDDSSYGGVVSALSPSPLYSPSGTWKALQSSSTSGSRFDGGLFLRVA